MKRLFDLVLFVIAILCLLAAVLIGLLVTKPEQQMIVGLGMIASSLAALLDFRQKTIHDGDHIKSSLLSGGLSARYLNAIARLRHKVVALKIIVVLAGLWVSGYGAEHR